MPEFPRVRTCALDVANYLLSLAEQEKVAMDPMKLQKILYFCQCWSLFDGSRLFDDPVEAWRHGPVVRTVWKAHSGSSNIRPADSPRFFELASDQMEMIQGVWEMLKNQSGLALSRKTHMPDTAWRKARHGLPDTADSDQPIDLREMAEDAAKIHQGVEAKLSAAWKDVIECEQ